MKADRTVRLLKNVPGVVVDFGGLAVTPALSPTAPQGYNDGWTVLTATTAPNAQEIVLQWDDTMDVSGIQAAELSLINQGGAVAFCTPPLSGLPEPTYLHQTTYVSTNPLRGTFLDRVFLGNALAAPGESQDWFLATAQTWSRDNTSSGALVKTAENNWGTGTVASTTKLFLRSYILIRRSPNYYVGSPTAAPPFSDATFIPFDLNAGSVSQSPMSVALSMVTAELNDVATAAAIMRGNELQQSYDN